MQKSFLKVMSLVMSIALILITGIIYIQQTLTSQSQFVDQGDIKIDEVISTIEKNNSDIIDLKASLNVDYIEKAKTFAKMIEMDKSILTNKQELNAICKLLQVDELHVTDASGIIHWGTVENYYGFDFNSSEQSTPFLGAITNPNFELAQEPQPNGATGAMFQYVGVARTDEPGIVQIGLTPEKLDTALENNKLTNVLAPFTIGTNGYILVLSTTDSTVSYHKNASLIGLEATAIGLDKSIISSKSEKGFATIDNEKIYYYK